MHKSRAVPTLASLQEPVVPMRTRAQKLAGDIKLIDGGVGDDSAAGMPSGRSDGRRPSFAGRRSRRNSSSDDSQLTIENFGGSQDQLHMIGRTLERERKSSVIITAEPAVAVRSSLKDARGSIQFGYDDDDDQVIEKQDNVANLSARRNDTLPSMTHSKEKNSIDSSDVYAKAESANNSGSATPVRKTSFATLPNTTTWQQQSVHYQHADSKSKCCAVDGDKFFVLFV